MHLNKRKDKNVDKQSDEPKQKTQQVTERSIPTHETHTRSISQKITF